MDPQGQFVATILDHASTALAAGAAGRIDAAGGSGIEGWGFPQLSADARARLHALGEALASGSPELLEADIEWLTTSYAARKIGADYPRRMLQALREELSENLPSEAAETADRYLESALGSIDDAPSELPSALPDDAPSVDLARKYLLAVLEGHAGRADELILAALERGVTVPELHHHVLMPVQVEMGRMWQAGDVDIAEEHLGSQIVEGSLALLRSRMGRAEPNGRTVLVAAVHGNQHDIGARIVADHFEMAGWRSLFLGANTPPEDLAAAAGHHQADLVALSAGLGLQVRATAEAVTAVRQVRPGLPILVGGRPFLMVQELWQAVGADGFARDAADAVKEGERLTVRPS